MKTFGKALLILLASFAVLAITYHVGKNAGEAQVNLDWANENAIRDKATAALKEKVADLEQKNAEATKGVADEIAAQSKAHEDAIAAMRIDFDARLLQSTTRAGIYRKQAQGSAVERDNLASYAAELDRSLEEGRSLVRELGATIRQRDSTIQSLSKQIKADRNLLSE